MCSPEMAINSSVYKVVFHVTQVDVIHYITAYLLSENKGVSHVTDDESIIFSTLLYILKRTNNSAGSFYQ